MRTLPVCCALLSLMFALGSARASAQDLTTPPLGLRSTPAPVPTRYRVDFDVFTPGVGVAAFEEPDGRRVEVFPSGQTGIRTAFATGDGFFADISFSSNLSIRYLLHETGYLRRFYLSGGDYSGLAIELQGGFSVGLAEGTAQGGAISGGNVAVSIDGRIRSFVMGVMIRYRVLYDGTQVHHLPSALLRITFGFWGE